MAFWVHGLLWPLQQTWAESLLGVSSPWDKGTARACSTSWVLSAVMAAGVVVTPEVQMGTGASPATLWWHCCDMACSGKSLEGFGRVPCPVVGDHESAGVRAQLPRAGRCF